jgi:hypothetical protein
MWSKRENVAAVICLAVGSAGQLVQSVITPVHEADSAKQNVARAIAHPAAMQAAAWLDLTTLFFLPALVVVAYLAGARTTRLGWIGAVLAIGATVPGIAYVLAPDVLYAVSAHGAVTGAAIQAYNDAGVVGVATIVFLVGHVLGLVLLAVALWRAGTVPKWAAISLGLYPVLEIAGGTGFRPAGVLAYLLLTAAFCASAVTLTRRGAAAVESPAATALARS